MENNIKQTSSNNKKLFVLVGILVVVAIIIIVAASQGTKKANVTQEPASPANVNVNTTEQTGGESTTTPAVNESTLPAGTRADAPGTALITQDNKVVNVQGVEVKNNVIPGSPEAPHETGAITKDQVAKSAINVTVASTGFKPTEFRVKANQPVTLAITGGDQWAHVFAFRDPVLSAIAVGIGGEETRAITFKAPAKGEYEYYCNIPGHPSRGEVGKMIVE